MNDEERIDLAEWAMNLALKSGASGAAVEINTVRQIEVEVRDGKLDKLTEAQRNRLSTDIYLEKRYSSHSTNDLRRDALERFIKDAADGTHYLARDEYRALPDPKYYPERSDGDLAIFDPTYAKLETEARIRMAQDMEAAARAASDRIISSTASYSDWHSEFVRVHSNGFLGGSRGTRFEVGVDVSIQDEGGARPGDWWAAETRFRRDLPDLGIVGTRAVERALRKIGQKKIASGRYDCLVENRAARRLLRMLQEPLGARALQQRSSFLEGMLGKRVASGKFSMIDDPTLERGLASRFFDGEGLAARRMPIIEGGMLRNYYVDTYYGRKLGMEPTAGGPSNTVFEYGERSLEEIVKDVDKGILVQEFIGGNSNPTTGDFSTGVAGILIEKGELTSPVHEMNISGNARELLRRLAEVGNDPYLDSAARTPSLLFEGVEFSGL